MQQAPAAEPAKSDVVLAKETACIPVAAAGADTHSSPLSDGMGIQTNAVSTPTCEAAPDIDEPLRSHHDQPQTEEVGADASELAAPPAEGRYAVVVYTPQAAELAPSHAPVATPALPPAPAPFTTPAAVASPALPPTPASFTTPAPAFIASPALSPAPAPLTTLALVTTQPMPPAPAPPCTPATTVTRG
jgi:hypothetical protein